MTDMTSIRNDLSNVMRHIHRDNRRSGQAVVSGGVDHGGAAIYYEEATYEGRPYNLPLIILKTAPCRWLLSHGGCTTCNYQQVASFKPVDPDRVLEQLDDALHRLGGPGRYPYLHLTSSGSFLDPREIGDDLLVRLCDRLHRYGVELLSTECRADLLDDSRRLDLFRRAFPGRISVGIGVESQNEVVRNLCMFKGVTNAQVETAFRNLKERDMDFHAYILLGKPFLTEGENVRDALETVRFTLERGGSALLMLANLQPNTLTHAMWRAGRYALPSLWAPIEVLERLDPQQRSWVSVKGIDKAVPQPMVFQKSCDVCTPIVRNALVGYNWTMDYRIIEQVLTCCPCREEWRNALADDPRPVPQRVAEGLAQLKAL